MKYSSPITGHCDSSLRCARTVEEVEDLRPIWELWQRHPNTDIDFYLTILGSRPEIIAPHVVLVERQNVPRLLVVGRIEERPLSLSLGYKSINGPSMRMLMVLYGGILGEGSREDEAMVMHHFQQMLNSGQVDLIFFNHLDVNSSFYNMASTFPPRICRANGLTPNPHHSLVLNGTYKDYLASLSKSTRKNLNRYGARLRESWGESLIVKCYCSPKDLDTVIRDAEWVACTTYQRGLGVGFTDSQEMRQRLSLEFERGWLRAYYLYRGNRPAAFSFINCYRGVAYANETGYDPAFSEYRIGHYLNERIIEELFEDPEVSALDYGFGDAEYKQAICNHVWNEVPVYIFSPRLRGLCLHALQTSVEFCGHVGRMVMTRIRLLPILKRAWRRSRVPYSHTVKLMMVWLGIT